MKSFKTALILLFVSVSVAKAQKVEIITTELFTKNEVFYADKSDSMPLHLVYDSITYVQPFPFGHKKRKRGRENYEFTLVGWFMKTEKNKINYLFLFQNFVQGVIIDRIEKTQANYPFIYRESGNDGLSEVLYFSTIHMDLNPVGSHSFIHYTGFFKNKIPDIYGSFEHLSLNAKGGLMLEECLYKGTLTMAKRNGEGCYSNERPEVARRGLEYDRSSRGIGMNNANLKYGMPILSICRAFNMDTLLYARYDYEDGSKFIGTINMPFEYPAPYLHYYQFFELKGNGTFTKSDGTDVTGDFFYPYIYVNGQKILVVNPANIKRDVYVSATYKLCSICGGGGLISKGVTTSCGVVVLEKKELGNNYVQYSTTRNATSTFYSLKKYSVCENGRIKTNEGYVNKVSIKR